MGHVVADGLHVRALPHDGRLAEEVTHLGQSLPVDKHVESSAFVRLDRSTGIASLLELERLPARLPSRRRARRACRCTARTGIRRAARGSRRSPPRDRSASRGTSAARAGARRPVDSRPASRRRRCTRPRPAMWGDEDIRGCTCTRLCVGGERRQLVDQHAQTGDVLDLLTDQVARALGHRLVIVRRGRMGEPFLHHHRTRRLFVRPLEL